MPQHGSGLLTGARLDGDDFPTVDSLHALLLHEVRAGHRIFGPCAATTRVRRAVDPKVSGTSHSALSPATFSTSE